MSALPNQFINNNLTESEARKFIKFNWSDLQNAANKNVLNTTDKIKQLEELQSVNIIGQILGIKAPAWKESELFKLIKNNWDYFSSIGVTQPLSYKLSYKAIVYILQLYEFPLKVDYSNNKVKVNRVATTKFPYTEEQSLAILKLNQEKLEESSGVSVYELNRTTNLSKALKTNQTSLYKLLNENLAELELLGCSKEKSWILTYRGVVFLLNKQKYPLNLNFEVKPKVVYLHPKSVVSKPITLSEEPVVNSQEPNLEEKIEELKAFFADELLKRKTKYEETRLTTEKRFTELKIVQSAKMHLEMVEECLQDLSA
jgi:hypothetical protein